MVPFLKELFLPPGIFIALGLFGVLRIANHPRQARRILIFVAVCLYVLSTKAFAALLMAGLYQPAPASAAHIGDPEIGAIVVLGAGLYEAAPEYGRDTASGVSLQRIRYGAHLHRANGKPILVSGGRPESTELSEAETMRAVLEDEFNVPVAWIEDRSKNTREQARLVRDILAGEGIKKILLVTHSSHMARAQGAFERVGFEVTPTATSFWSHPKRRLTDYMPTAGGLAISRHALHEILGRMWYALRG